MRHTLINDDDLFSAHQRSLLQSAPAHEQSCTKPKEEAHDKKRRKYLATNLYELSEHQLEND